MAYTITPTNGQNPIVIADGTINTSTTVTLVGKNYPNYGNILDQNFIRLLENSANTTAPSSPLRGEIWWDSASNILKVYTGSVWKNVGSTTSGPTQPTTNNVGDLWWKSDTGVLYGYDVSGNYKLIGPQTGLAGITAETLSDGASDYDVISFKVEGEYYMILSTQGVTAFSPSPSIDGFQTIYPGLNLISSDFLTNAKFVGQASDAITVGGIYPNAFIRSDQNSSTNYTLAVNNNSGLSVGAGAVLNISASAPNVAITNTTSTGVMNFRVNSGSGTLNAVDIFPNGNLVCNYDMVVKGSAKFVGGSGDFYISSVTQSTSTTTGALRVDGGTGIVKNLWVGGYANIFGGTSTESLNAGTITATTIRGSTIGNSGATLTGTLSTAAQTNITSVGTLNGVTVSSTTSLTTLNVSGVTTLSGALTVVGAVTVPAPSSNLHAATKLYVDTAVAAGVGGIVIPSVPTSSGTTGQVAFFTGASATGSSVNFTWNGSTLYVNGALNVTGDITAYYTSDARLKTNIFNIENALDKVNRLNGVTFEWNETGRSLFDEDFVIPDLEVGVIAQEIQAVLPEVVTTRNNGMLAVNYEKIVPLLIEAIKELSAEVTKLKAAR